MASVRNLVGGATVLVLLWGCGNKDSVSLAARVESPVVSVTSSALGSKVTGSFDLVLSLGSEAPEDTTVELSQVSLVRNTTELRSSVDAVSSEPFPRDVSVGEEETVAFEIDDDALLSDDEKSAICGEPLSVRVVVTDSLSDDRTTSAVSARVTADCD